MNAIGIKIKKADGKHDLSASKFFGAPVIPAKWSESFSDDVIFLHKYGFRILQSLTRKTSCRIRAIFICFLILKCILIRRWRIIMTASRMSLLMFQRSRTAVCSSERGLADEF